MMQTRSMLYAVVPTLLILCVAAGLFFIARAGSNHPIVVDASPTPAPTLPPMPTEIDANFLAQVEQCLLPVAAVYGYDLRISSGFRTLEEQDALYQQGRTVDGHIVTDVEPGRSVHNYGLAVDVVDRWRAFDINWERIGAIAAYCGLEQGDEGDSPHISHRMGLTMEDLRVGKRLGPLSLPCAVMAQKASAGQKLTLLDLINCGAPKF